MRTTDDRYGAILAELEKNHPDLAAQARDLLARDETFRAICQDYHEAAAAAQQFARSEGERASRAQMFRGVMQELMTEAATYLERNRTQGGG